jgi:predicted AAA+ superfamily ATPase
VWLIFNHQMVYFPIMIERHLTQRLLAALGDTPVIYLQGARQTGKSTLVQELAQGAHPASYYTLDSAAVLAAAEGDPEGFIAGLSGRAVIDEVQRAPGLALAIKAAVDRDRTPGRFILTGSANVMALPRLSESLAGRVELHTLWPFSQDELEGREQSFADDVFSGRVVRHGSPEITEAELLERILLGGYPEVQTRKRQERRSAWFESYITTILQRDVRDISSIERLAEVPKLLGLLASRACSLVNYADIARTLAMPQSTLKRYLALLEATFLMRLLPAWSSNLGKRLIKSPKLVLTDTGLLGHVLGLDRERAVRDRILFGHVLENFVAMEVVKQITWSRGRFELFHFRTTAGQEVDLVLENAAGDLVGIEVKAGAKVEGRDFAGLRLLADLAGQRFRQGVVFYTGESVVPFGKNLHAMPVHFVWR